MLPLLSNVDATLLSHVYRKVPTVRNILNEFMHVSLAEDKCAMLEVWWLP